MKLGPEVSKDAHRRVSVGVSRRAALALIILGSLSVLRAQKYNYLTKNEVSIVIKNGWVLIDKDLG